MKELSIEDKAARYDKAIEVAKRNYDAIVEMDENCTFAKSGIINTFHRMFPELKESEDERIRKYLLKLAERCPEDSIDFMSEVKKEDVIAYLERQKPTTDIQNLTWEDIAKIDEIINMVQHENLYGIGAKCFYTDVLERFLDGKQTKQKPINYADEEIVEAVKDTSILDMVEPKFKVGDWVVYCNEDVDLITGIEENGYCTNNGSGYIPFVCASDIRLWTIQDAKDGDVLYSLDSKQPFIYNFRKPLNQAEAYCGINIYRKFFVWNTKDCVITLDKYVPATKEQRELLFQKMKEAGYKWDADKKELKKVEQNSAWSEEDEEMLSRIDDSLKALRFMYISGGEEDRETWKAVDEEIKYIKSLKDRLQPQWRPSSQHIAALDYQVNSTCKGSWQYKASKELLEQLKKL